MKIFLLTALCALLSVHLSFATIQQERRWQGRVEDSKSKHPVEFADVVILDDQDKSVASALTSPDGSYNISTNHAGTVRLMVRCIGYNSYISAPFPAGKSDKAIKMEKIILAASSHEIAEIEVTGRKRQVIYKLDKRVVEAGTNLNSTGGTAVDVLRNAPSISIDVEGNVKFRGSSGFTVYVNGRPSLWEGTQALEQIPASQIENIEIITTPSARYETDGSVGILNIITKKDGSELLTGTVNANLSSVGAMGANVLISQKTKALTWVAGANASKNYRKSNYEQSKQTIVNDTTNHSFAKGTRVGRNYNYSLKGGLVYDLPRTKLMLDLEGGYRGSGYEGKLNYEDQISTAGSVFSKNNYRSYDYKDLHETYLSGDIGFEHKFKREGEKLYGNFFITYGGDAMELFESDLFDKAEQRTKGHRAREAEYRITMRGNLSYVMPFRKEGKWESGYQYNMYMEDGDYKIDMWDPANRQFSEWKDQFCRFVFRRDIHTLYTMLSDRVGNFSYQAGVRGEYTHRFLESSIKWAEHTEKRMEFFPSAHLSYTLKNSNTFTGGYSRRTTRPQLFFMEPYITFVDIYTAQTGNPAVRAEYIDAFDLGYKKDFGKNYFTVELFHRYRRDKIERIKGIYSPGVTLDSIANVGDDYSSGAEMTMALSLKKWWALNLSGNLFYYQVKNQFKTDGEDAESLNWQARFSNTFNVAKRTTIQFDGEFVGPSVSTQGRTDAYLFFNLGVRQVLLKEKLLLTLSVQDLFATARYTGTQRAPGVDVQTTIRPYSPLAMLSVSYTFNNFKGKKEEAKSFGEIFEGTYR